MFGEVTGRLDTVERSGRFQRAKKESNESMMAVREEEMAVHASGNQVEEYFVFR